jgi:hypothetical protein
MILYHYIPHKRINGTLFYCFEYFAFLNTLEKTEFWIFGISDRNLDYIKKIFKNKYNVSDKLLEKIRKISLKDFITVPKKIIILDNRTYNNLRSFLGSKKVFWFNNHNGGIKKNENDKTYGEYSYQNFEIKEGLKFYFDIYKKISKSENKIYLSSPSKTDSEITKILNSKNIFLNGEILFKNPNLHLDNLFEKFSTLVYLHNGQEDGNNRLIIESYYYNKNILLFDYSDKEDSVHHRFHLGSKNLDYFYLTKENKLIKDYLDS